LSGSASIALSPDGRRLAFLRTIAGRTVLVVRSLATDTESVKADRLDQNAALLWTADSEQLFYVGYSYKQPSTRVGRYDIARDRWELSTINVGDGIGAIPISRREASSFFTTDLVAPRACPGANGSFPSDRKGTCTFRF
jgi:hypothetical protein